MSPGGKVVNVGVGLSLLCSLLIWAIWGETRWVVAPVIFWALLVMIYIGVDMFLEFLDRRRK